MSLREWLFGDSEDTSETKTEEETRTLTDHYTVTRATVTYPDGSEERIEYTDVTFGDDITKVRDHDASDYTAYWKRPGMYTSGALRLDANKDKPRRFSMANVRDIEPNWVDEMVAVAEVKAEVTYKRNADGDWEEQHISLCEGEDTPDVTVWHKSEWKAEQD